MRRISLWLMACVLALAAQADVVDVLDQSVTGVTGTTYARFSDKKAASDAVYAGECAGGSGAIQLRTENKKEGIVSTSSGGKLKQVTIEWHTRTSSGRTLQIYASNTPYTSASDLFDEKKQGMLLGEYPYNESVTTFTINIAGDYTYIGVRSADGALYLHSVTILWDGEGQGGGGNDIGDDQPKRGDVNGDGKVDISDVTTVVNIVLGKE